MLQNTIIFIKHTHTFYTESIRSPVDTQDCKSIIFIKEIMVLSLHCLELLLLELRKISFLIPTSGTLSPPTQISSVKQTCMKTDRNPTLSLWLYSLCASHCEMLWRRKGWFWFWRSQKTNAVSCPSTK